MSIVVGGGGTAAEKGRAGLVMLVFLTSFLPAHGWAAAYGSVSGIIRDTTGRPIAGAQVVLESAAHAFVRRVADAVGHFDFPQVAIGHYTLTISQRGFASSSQPLTVVSGYFPSAAIELRPSAELAQVTVTATRNLPVVASVTPTTIVGQEDIEHSPGAINANSLAMITDYVPGAYEAHDMLHMRGGHQTDWLIDGVEIPNTNIAENLGPAIDPLDVQTLGVARGSYPADEGDRTYGIITVIPKSGFSSTDQAQLDVTAGNFGQTDDYLSAASHTGGFAYYASLEGNRSNLGLQTPIPHVIHDDSLGYGGFMNLQYDSSAQDAVSFVGQLRQDVYQIPDCNVSLDDDADCAGQIGDGQREADNFALLSWAHTLPKDAVLTSSLMYHFGRADYDGGPSDYPIITRYHHSSRYQGAEESLRVSVSRNHLEFGVFGFLQQDRASFGLAFNDHSSPTLTELVSPTGGLASAWAQDTFEATHWLTLSGGVRESYFQSRITENATDPRLGASLLVPRLAWVLSAFWGKYYQAPPLQTLSGPLVAYATASDTAFLPLHGERDEEHQFELAIPVWGWSIDADYFVTAARNFFDHNPLGESNIFLPLTDQGASIRGTELTVRSPVDWQYGQVHLAYSNQSADCFGAVTGGLVVAGTACGYPPTALDHDQRNTLALGYNATLPWELFVAANLSFNSGLSNGDGPPSHLPSYTVVDLTVGRNISHDLAVSVTTLNVTDEHLLTDNSLTFGGVHWNNPFQIYAEVRYKFRY